MLKKDRIFHHRKAQNKDFLVAQTKTFQESVNIIFPLNFCLKRDRISHHGKAEDKNMSISSKYNFSTNFLSGKENVYVFRISYPKKIQGKGSLATSKR